MEHFEKFHCNRIFLLGDILYHGPRNPLPTGHGPMGVVDELNKHKDYITAVRGNCDAEVDLMLLEFEIADEYRVVEDKGFKVFLSHGHIFEPELMKPQMADIYMFGHTHNYLVKKNNQGVVMCNPGSTSLPKGFEVTGQGFLPHPPTFAIYDSENCGTKGDGTFPTFTIYHMETGEKVL